MRPAGSSRKRPGAKRYRDDHFLRKIGERIRKVRLAKGYSIDRLCLESDGLSRATVSHIEHGKIDPQISTLKRIADTIGVEFHDLVKERGT